ncbi:MAG: hypothetical protein MJ252_08500 [archaeon]|nr:hypothetical protein [archaeon]
MTDSNSSLLKKNLKLKNITYISPSHSKTNLTNDSQRILNTSGGGRNLISRNNKNISHTTHISQLSQSNNPRLNNNNMINDFYRSSSSNSRSQVYSLSRNAKMGFLKKPVNTSNIITTSTSTSHNNSVNSSTFNYPYNYSNYSSAMASNNGTKRRKTSAPHSSALSNNLVKSQSSSNYLGINSKYRNNVYSKDLKRSQGSSSHASHQNLKGNINVIGVMGVNPSPSTGSNMKSFYNELSKGIKSLSKPQRNEENRSELMGSQGRLQGRLQSSGSYYGGSERKRPMKESQIRQLTSGGNTGLRKGSGTSGQNQGTYSQGSCSVHDKETMGSNANKMTISEVETPEELHFYYVHLLQAGKKVENKFDI